MSFLRKIKIMTPEKKKEVLRLIKYVCIAASAGAIQFISTLVLTLIWPKEKFSAGPALFYLIGLVLSVIWNLTINRKYTFKSTANMSRAIWLTVAFYVVFAPASTLLQAWLVNGDVLNLFTIPHLNIPELVAVIICMFVNLGLEYPFQRFIVFKDSIDSRETPTKE